MKNFYALLVLAFSTSACSATPEDVEFGRDPYCTTEPTGPSGSGGDGGSVSSTGGAGGGCTGEAEGPLEGSRLKHRRVLNDDGSVQVLPGWYDTVRQENCTFKQMVNGGLRCVPMDDVIFTRVFLDAACTIPLAMPDVTPPCNHSNMPKPRYVEWTSGDACWVVPPIHIGEVESVPLVPDIIYEQKVNGECGNGGFYGGAVPFYALKTELSAQSFVGESAQ